MRSVLVLVLSLSVAACTSTSSTQPELASSAAQSSYATSYPDELQGAAKAFSDDRAEARTLTAGLGQRASELKGAADPNALVGIVDRADEAGRSRGYASRRQETEQVRTFWEEERNPITGRVAGAAQNKVVESKCENTDVSGTVAYSLKDGVDKQIEKRLRAKNEAQILLDRYKTTLGQGNAVVAQKLADDVAAASYVVNVGLVDDRNRLTRLLAEKGSIDTTLQRTIDEERAFQAEKGRTDAEKKASEERIATLNKSRSALGGAVVNADVATRGIDDQIKTAKSEYDAALKALKDQIKARPVPPAAAQ
jgi:hypothetical protein